MPSIKMTKDAFADNISRWMRKKRFNSEWQVS